MKALKHHPLADLLPPMSEAEYGALKSNIAEQNQRDDIDTFEGKVLDGRHRQRALIELKLKPRYRKFKGTHADALALVYSRAVHRNMTDSQKACAAVRIEPELAAAAAKRRGVAGKAEGKARDQAGHLFGVSGRYVQDAKLVFERDRKLFQEVFEGRTFLTRAKSQIRREEKRQNLARLSRVALSSPLSGSWEIRCADAVAELRTGITRGSYGLAFADPPYNLGVDYGKGKKADLLPEDDYFKWCGDWIRGLYNALCKSGSLWLLINHENAARMESVLRCNGFSIRAWITWYETFGINCLDNFNRTSRRLFYCVKDPRAFTFHHGPFTRPSARQLIYGDKRAATHGKLFDDVWIIPRLVGNAAETLPGGKTQLPVELLKPIIAGCSNPGERVIEVFSGSGSFIEAAIALNRLPLGIDNNKSRVEAARARCSAVKQEVKR